MKISARSSETSAALLLAAALSLPWSRASADPRVTLTRSAESGRVFDYARARPMPLPRMTAEASNRSPALGVPEKLAAGAASSSSGSPGDGRLETELLFPHAGVKRRSDAAMTSASTAVSMAYGSTGHPYTTSRVDLPANNASGTSPVSRLFPFRPTGKLYIAVGFDTYECSASLIQRGLVVTAAHCVSEFGSGQVHADIEFIPAYHDGIGPYGRWSAESVGVLTAYLDGTDSCAPSNLGVVCLDDIAVVTLRPKKSPDGTAYYAGDRAGWYSYAWNGFGFSDQSQALISQLGYPVALDAGSLMQRNDSQAYVSIRLANNSIVGTAFGPGSSGGPWLVNLGIAAGLGDVSGGSASKRNTVVGVTSWGYDSPRRHEQGASPFLSSNIRVLVNRACKAAPAACAP